MRLAAAAVALAVLVAGCGSGHAKESNRYVDSVNAAQGRFTTTLDRLSGAIGTSTTPAQDRRTLRAFEAAVGRAVGALRGIEPPAEVRPLHRRLIGELDVYGREVRRETGVLRSDDPKALVAAQRRLLAFTNESASRINATIDEINRRLQS
jgi:hypothetical protein